MGQEITLRDLRMSNEKTAAEVATVLGISRSTYSNYEQGTRTINIELIIPLAKLFECSAEEIIQAQINSYHSDR